MTAPTLLYLEFARTQQAGDPYAYRFGPQDYTLRAEGGAIETVRLDWSQQLLDDLQAVRLPGRDPALLQSLGNRLASMLQSATWNAHESQIVAAAQSPEASADELAVVLTIRSAASELYMLPWELLTLRDSGQHLGGLPNVLVRYEWPKGTSPPAESSARKELGRILLAHAGAVPASEHQTGILSAAQEGMLPFDASRDVLAQASGRSLPAALESARRSGIPISVLHILCHGTAMGTTYGLALAGENPGDAMVAVDAGRFRQLLAPYAGMVRLVVLMACDSGNSGALGNQLGSIAQTLHRAGFAQVIASRYPLSVRGSIRFVESFYRALLCSLSSVEQALLRTRTELARSCKELDWAAIQLYAAATSGANSRPLSFRPYRGLLAYEPEQRRFFFGREEELQEVLAELHELVQKKDRSQPRLQIVEGPSGVGKSSLVLAGVAPLLSEQGWLWTSLRPGAEPLAALDAALKRLESADATRRRLLIVDQLEELFSHVPEDRHSEREQFVQRLWQLSGEPEGTLSVLCTLRTDYRGHCASIRLEPPEAPQGAGGRRLDSLFGKTASLHNTYVQQMTPAHLREVIERPAERVGLTLAEGLSERLLQEVGTEPGALALMQHTLEQLWLQREGRVLTQRAYDALGGVTGALNRHAEAVVAALLPPELDEARRILVQLVARPGESAQYTRRCVALGALCPEDAQRRLIFTQVMDKLTEAQLLVVRRVDDGADGLEVAEVAHEALIRTWSRLGEWVRSEQAFLALRDQIMQWVAEWQRNPQELLTPARLASVEQFDQQRPGELHQTARQLLERSRQALRDAEAERARHTAELQAAKDRALDSARRARDQVRIAAALDAASDPTTQASILREVERPSEALSLRLKLLFDVLAQPLAVFVLPPANLLRSELSPDASLVLTLDPDGVRLLRVDGAAAPLVLPVGDSAISSGKFFPDGERVALISNTGTLRIFGTDGSESAPLGGTDHTLRLRDISPDGDWLLTTGDAGVQLWRTDGSGKVVTLAGQLNAGAAFSPDGTHVVAYAEQTSVQVLSADGSSAPVILDGHGKAISSARFSPDGSRIVTVSADGMARVFLADGSGEPVTLTAADSDPAADPAAASAQEGTTPAYIRFACFSPDGSSVLTTSSDKLARLWSADGSGEPLVFSGHLEEVTSACFSADGSRIATMSLDRSVRVWSTDGPTELAVLIGGAGEPESVAFCSQDEQVAVRYSDGEARIYPLTPSDVVRTLDEHDSELSFAAFSSSGDYALTLSQEGLARVFSLRSEAAPVVFGSAKTPLRSVCFSPDEKSLLAVLEDGTARLWRTDGKGKPTVLRIAKKLLARALFTSAGARVCLISSDGDVQSWRADGTGAPVVLASEQGSVAAVFPSPDGSRVLLCFEDGTARLLFTDGAIPPVPLPDHPGGVRSADFSGDGTLLVTTAEDLLVRLYCIPAGAQLPSPLAASVTWEVPGFSPSSASLAKSGKLVLTSTDNGTHIWRIDGTRAPVSLRYIGQYVSTAFLTPDDQYILYYRPGAPGFELSTAERNSDAATLPAADSLVAFAFSPDSGYLLLTCGTTPKLYPLSPARLVERLWRATRYCLPVDDRVLRLGESEEQARAGYEAAQQRLRSEQEAAE